MEIKRRLSLLDIQNFAFRINKMKFEGLKYITDGERKVVHQNIRVIRRELKRLESEIGEAPSNTRYTSKARNSN